MADEERSDEMSEEESSDEEQEQEEQEQEEQDEGSGDGDQQAEMKRIRAALKKANAEAAKRRKELERFQAEEQRRKDAELSDVEKAQRQAAEWQGKFDEISAALDGMRMRQAFYDAAATAKVAFANGLARQDAFDLSDLSGVEIGDDGAVSGMDEVLKALQKDRPHLFGVEKKKDINADDGGDGKKKKGAAADDEAVKRRFGI